MQHKLSYTIQAGAIKRKAKISFLAAILQSLDPLLRVLQVFLSEPKSHSCLGFSSTICNYMTSAAS